MNTLLQDVEITGTLSFTDDFIFHGKIEGEIHSPGILTLGEDAVVTGDVKTRAVVIFGKVEGSVTVQERCEMRASAVVLGDVTAGTFAVEEGATLVGRSKVGKAAAAAAAAANKSA